MAEDAPVDQAQEEFQILAAMRNSLADEATATTSSSSDEDTAMQQALAQSKITHAKEELARTNARAGGGPSTWGGYVSGSEPSLPRLQNALETVSTIHTA